MCLRCMLLRVANASRTAYQAKIRTLGGAPHFHRRFHAGLNPSGLVLDSPTHCRAMILSLIMLYAERTEKHPCLSGCHAITSSPNRLDALIFSIFSASIGKKCCLRIGTFHVPSAFRSSATHLSLQRRLGVIGLKGAPFGIQGSRHILMFAPFPTRHIYPCFTSSKPCSIANQVLDPLPVKTVSVILPDG